VRLKTLRSLFHRSGITALLLLASSFLASAESLAQSRHVVFLIHGIGASAKQFKTTETVLKDVMPSLDPAFSYEFVRFEYETGDDQRTTLDFAKDLGTAMAAHFSRSTPIVLGDKISLVMHSQGGVVGLLWLWNAFGATPEFHPELAPHVDGFITLGTPFWGAKIATFSHMLKDWATRFHLPFPFALGAKELREMSFGSETIFAIRLAASRPEFQEALLRIRHQIRPLSIGGIVGKLRPLAPFALGATEYEDDTAVPLPSSRFDFIFATANQPYIDGETLRFEEFQETGLANLQVVNAVHLSLTPELRHFPGIAQLPKRCARDTNCDHPTFSHIVNHLAGAPEQRDERLLKKLTGFIVDLSIRIPPDSKLKPSDVKIRFSDENYAWNPFKKSLVKVGHPLELYSRGRSKAENNPEYLRFFFTGSSYKSYIQPMIRAEGPEFLDRKLTFRVSAPGFKSRVIEAKVRATYTTFIELNLERK